MIACDFPVRVPAVPLQSDARETALAYREPLYAIIVSDVMTSPVKDGHWLAGHVIGSNRHPIAPLDRDPTGMESTNPSARSAVI